MFFDLALIKYTKLNKEKLRYTISFAIVEMNQIRSKLYKKKVKIIDEQN